MTKFLLLVHGAGAVALMGAVVHNGLTCLWRLQGRKVSSRLLRIYATTSALLALAVLALGAAVYPEFRTAIRPGFDRDLPVASMLFEIKEHVALTAVALLCAQAGLRRSPDLGGRLADWAGMTAAGAVLFASAVGGWLVTLDAP